MSRRSTFGQGRRSLGGNFRIECEDADQNPDDTALRELVISSAVDIYKDVVEEVTTAEKAKSIIIGANTRLQSVLRRSNSSNLGSCASNPEELFGFMKRMYEEMEKYHTESQKLDEILSALRHNLKEIMESNSAEVKPVNNIPEGYLTENSIEEEDLLRNLQDIDLRCKTEENKMQERVDIINKLCQQSDNILKCLKSPVSPRNLLRAIVASHTPVSTEFDNLSDADADQEMECE